MIRRLVLAAFVAVPLFCVAASAQSVDDIIKKNIEARGGLEKIKAITTARMTGTATLGPGLQAAALLQFKRPHSIRFEFTIQGKAVIQATDGTTAWQVNPFTGTSDAEAMSADDAKDLNEDSDLDGALVDYKAKGNTVELIGKEDFEGSEVYKLKVTHKDGDIDYTYIDAGSFLELKQTTKRTQQGKEIEVDSFPGNYKAVNGVLMPYSLEVKANGQTQFQVTFDTIEVNKPIEDAVFKMPVKAPAGSPP